MTPINHPSHGFLYLGIPGLGHTVDGQNPAPPSRKPGMIRFPGKMPTNVQWFQPWFQPVSTSLSKAVRNGVRHHPQYPPIAHSANCRQSCSMMHLLVATAASFTFLLLSLVASDAPILPMGVPYKDGCCTQGLELCPWQFTRKQSLQQKRLVWNNKTNECGNSMGAIPGYSFAHPVWKTPEGAK